MSRLFIPLRLFPLLVLAVTVAVAGWWLVQGIDKATLMAQVRGGATTASLQRSDEETELLATIRDIHNRLKEGPLNIGLISETTTDYEGLLRALPDTETANSIKRNFQQTEFLRLMARIDESFRLLQAVFRAGSPTDATTQRQAEAENRRLLQNLAALFEAVQTLPRMQAVMEAGAISGNAPLAVEFTAIRSSDPKNRSIAPQNFQWSFVDHDQQLKNLGTGVEKVVTFTEPGVYVVQLTLLSGFDDTVLPGIALSSEIRVMPPETTADFSINGYPLPNSGTVEVSVTDARKGLKFDPSPSVVAAERELVLYEWNIDGKRYSFTTPETVTEKFDLVAAAAKPIGNPLGGGSAQSGERIVEAALRVTDSVGKASTKRIRLAIRRSIAVIRTQSQDKSGKQAFRTNQPIVFDGSSSAVENTPSTQYTWLLTGPDNFQKSYYDQKFEVVFDTPGEYVMELTVGNGFKARETYLVLPQPPPALFSWRQATPSQPATIRFDAGESRDLRGRPLSYSWDFDGDGKYDIQNSSKPVAIFTYPRVGAFLAKLAVSDEFGETSLLEKPIEVTSVLGVDFSADSFAVQPGQEITFRAEAPSAVRFAWEPEPGIRKETTATTLSYAYPLAGRKEVKLTAFDAAGTANSVIKTVVVGDGKTPVPQASVVVEGETLSPVKNLCGPNKDAFEVYRHQVVELDSAASVNAAGQTSGLQYEWDFQDGTVMTEAKVTKKFVQLSGNNRCSKVVLAVQDTATGRSATADELLFYVQNAAPALSELQVRAPARCETPCAAELKAIGGFDADGQVTSYRWWAYREGNPEKVGVTVTKEASATIVLPARGAPNEENVYYFVVELTDDTGKAVTAEDALGRRSAPVTVVNTENPAPAIDFSVNRPVVTAGEAAIFTAAATDPLKADIPASAYAWDFDGDGTFDDTNSGPSASHTFASPGKYPVILRLKIRGIEVTREHEITVVAPQAYPQANFFHTRQGLRVAFDGSGSVPDPVLTDKSLAFRWDFDLRTDSDGNGAPDDDDQAVTEAPVFTYPAPGAYFVRLTVIDPDGRQGTYEQEVAVSAPAAARLLGRRSPRLLISTPSAQLELLIRPARAAGGGAFDMIIFGHDLRGFPLTGTPTIAVKEGSAEITSPPQPFDGGFSMARVVKSINDPVVIEVTARSALGEIRETLTF